jgi:hypothetical protein
MPSRGRPRLTPSDYEQRLRSYCERYGVTATAAGIPPFPTGRRETDQHREWMALYRVHSRLFQAAAARETVATGACPVCVRPVDGGASVPHRQSVLHPACHAVMSAVEPLGTAGLDRLRAYLWPDGPRRTPGRRRKA